MRFKVDELNQAMEFEKNGNKKMAEHHRNLAAKQDKRAMFFGELAAEKQKGIIDETTANFAKTSKKAENKLDSAVGKVEGTRMTNLNISIEKLIEKFEINTTNVSESVERIREEVSKALLEAVNDVNIIAGQ